MKTLHTRQQNYNKVLAFIEAVQQLNSQQKNLPDCIIRHEFESLGSLAVEAKKSLEELGVIL